MRQTTISSLPTYERAVLSRNDERISVAKVPKARLSRSSIRPRRLHQFFEAANDRTPDALALVCGEEQLTYAALDARANQLAHYLMACYDIRPGACVGILLERSTHTYVSLLAVLKCGAAFVPIDASYPEDRIAFITEDADTALLLTGSRFAAAVAGVRCPILNLEDRVEIIAWQPDTRPEIDDEDDALAYIIYTSGTTGRPKGVAISQASICNFISVCTPIYGVTAADRVYQGMTIAFDFSIEEIWPTFASGAALIAGPTDHRRLGSGLADFLNAQQVTMCYCTPTLLATVDREVPSLHTLLVGGEACPADLVKRWSRPGRRMLNTYGPTETTVTATYGELVPDRPVTIGKPLPTYRVYILDENLQPVPPGKFGEICIGGVGVARGYVNRPDLTANRFVPDRFASRRPGARLYRTGDLGRMMADGDIEFAGRIDSQVKIRGYRIELAEIEAILLENPLVKDGIVAVTSGDGAVQELVAYITLRGPISDEASLKSELYAEMRRRLPAYMVPAFLEILAAIPMLPSGKADRSRLPAPIAPRLSARTGAAVLPATVLEQELANAWSKVFGRDDLSVEDDFFTDLGGHSLFAAQVVSKLRQLPALRHLPISALYAHPTIRSLARHLEGAAQRSEENRPAQREVIHHGSARVWLCGLGQFALGYVLAIVLAIPLAQFLIVKIHPLLALSFAGLVAMPIALVLPFAAKWLLIGRFRPGRHRLWGWYYCRFWLVRKILGMSPLSYLAGSPFLAPYLRLLGARIGKGCHLGSARLQLPDLIEIGEGASIGYGVAVEPYIVKDGWLIMAPIRIGKDSYTGTNAVVMLGGHVGDGSRVMEQSLVACDQVIPDNETWAGSPSQRVANDPVLDRMASQQGPGRWSAGLLAGFVAAFVFLELLPLLMVGPALVFLVVVSGGDMLDIVAWSPVAGILFVFTACFLLAVAKRAIMPAAHTGIFPLRSWFGLRKWLADSLMNTSLAVTNSLYATLYTAPWLRLLGAKIGPRAEVSTVSHIDPDLLVLGAESFVADLAVLGAARHYRGCIDLGMTEIGTRTFVGNAALVPSNTSLPHNSLIGVQSVPPSHPIEAGTSWLGSPAIFLPHRQPSAKFDESVTFRPTPRLVVCRLTIEFFRIVLPSMLLSAFGLLGTLAVARLASVLSLPLLAAVLPGIYLVSALLLYLTVAGLKWLVVGRYQPRVAPMWSHFVWRSELITALYESAAVPALLGGFTGTPFLAPLLRLLGVRMGRRVYIETTYMTEFDLVRVDDDAMIGGTTSLQTHLFEDRVMKMSTVSIGAGCTVGPRAVVLYDSQLEEGAELDALSLVMKGERLPAETQWRGIPAQLSQ
ncbi:MAG TPA: Pls/PosA family non-ribosomal peptide synthetase [Gemmataceae bacterium]|nr:Pls/PosA family non-ribosomal peptide synthetase [Gemmataceae bacterium]